MAKVDRIVAIVAGNSGLECWTTWDGYDHTYMTREPLNNINDKALVRNYKAKPHTVPNWGLWSSTGSPSCSPSSLEP